MTTIIVTKDRILSDGQVSLGDRVDNLDFKKIRKIGNFLVGGAGRLSSVLTFFSWFEQCIKMEEIQRAVPELVIENNPEKPDEEFHAVVLHPDGQIFYHEGNDPTRAYPLDVEYYAIGSGGDYALAALDGGATPEKAMEVAKFRDVFSGGETFVEYLGENIEEVELTREVLQSFSQDELINIMLTGSPTGEAEEGIEEAIKLATAS